ncbi:hypothetical protein GGX14DRAFT_401899 [Mycena pura]|uniref:Uncharacterized protein n=1 Tax=Mycena pura TaxID=153505 RepID=A0AAD6UZT9_9AGAR|nr:hypothetical protein GGX14DRAFT_401899 [Mycena pura]
MGNGTNETRLTHPIGMSGTRDETRHMGSICGRFVRPSLAAARVPRCAALHLASAAFHLRKCRTYLASAALIWQVPRLCTNNKLCMRLNLERSEGLEFKNSLRARFFWKPAVQWLPEDKGRREEKGEGVGTRKKCTATLRITGAISRRCQCAASAAFQPSAALAKSTAALSLLTTRCAALPNPMADLGPTPVSKFGQRAQALGQLRNSGKDVEMGQGVLSVFWAILSCLVLYVWGAVWGSGAYFRITRLSEMNPWKPAQGFWDNLTTAGTASSFARHCSKFKNAPYTKFGLCYSLFPVACATCPRRPLPIARLPLSAHRRPPPAVPVCAAAPPVTFLPICNMCMRTPREAPLVAYVPGDVCRGRRCTVVALRRARYRGAVLVCINLQIGQYPACFNMHGQSCNGTFPNKTTPGLCAGCQLLLTLSDAMFERIMTHGMASLFVQPVLIFDPMTHTLIHCILLSKAVLVVTKSVDAPRNSLSGTTKNNTFEYFERPFEMPKWKIKQAGWPEEIGPKQRCALYEWLCDRKVRQTVPLGAEATDRLTVELLKLSKLIQDQLAAPTDGPSFPSPPPVSDLNIPGPTRGIFTASLPSSQPGPPHAINGGAIAGGLVGVVVVLGAESLQPRILIAPDKFNSF